MKRNDDEFIEMLESMARTKQSDAQYRDNWDGINRRILAKRYESRKHHFKESLKLSVAVVASLLVVIGSISLLKNYKPGTDAQQQVQTLPSASQLIPGTYFGLQSYYGMSPSYASSDGQYMGFWKSDSGNMSTWIQDMNGHKWRVSSGKYYIVGSTPQGGVVFSSRKPNAPGFTYPSFVYQPDASSIESIPTDATAKITQYAAKSTNGLWATIELGSTTTGFEDSWVDVNGKRLKGLDHAQEIAWSSDGSKLAALIAVDRAPQVQGAPAWSVVQNEIAVYDTKTGKITKTNDYGMSGLSWSPDGQIIAVDCGEATQTSSAGFYEFRTDDLQQVKQFSSISPRDWSWLGGHTALVSSGQGKSWDLSAVTWNLGSGTTQTANVLQTTNTLYGLRTAGSGRCIVQDQQGLLLVQGSRVTRMVSKPVQTWWYNQVKGDLVYVVKNSDTVQVVKLSGAKQGS